MKLLKATSLLLALGAIDQALAAFADADKKVSGVTTTVFDVFNTEAECKAGTPVKKEAMMVTGTGCMPQKLSAPDGPAQISILTATAYERQKYTDKACATKDTAEGNKETWLFTCEAWGPSEWRKKSTKTAFTVWYENFKDSTCTQLTSEGYFSIKDGCVPGTAKSEKSTVSGGKLIVAKYTSVDCSGTATTVDYPLLSSCLKHPDPSVADTWIKNYQGKDASSFSAGVPAPMLAAAAAATCLFVHAVALFI